MAVAAQVVPDLPMYQLATLQIHNHSEPNSANQVCTLLQALSLQLVPDFARHT